EAGAEARWVERVVPVPNGWVDAPHARYRIPPGALRAAEAAAAGEGLAVLGAFHSHPDGGAEPSRYDLEHAWPWYTYLIVPVSAERVDPPRAWRLAEDRSAFREEPVVEEQG
ncbi:MAG TPA: Mov34/MPN/PAD-1 family protein, partial [Longimicrobiales bacterium]|nr:Mov34/MPN/PAD-1 family protein [Longimicrobiales bacterium]